MSCTDVQTIQAGNGSKTQFSFDFPYIFKSEIHVYFWNATTKEWDEKLTTDATYPWQVTDANPTIVEFTSTAPPAPATPVDPNESTIDNVKIRRITNLDDIRALFNPGSAIRSDDLNNNFEQLRYAIQESNCPGVTDEVYEYLLENYWDRFDNTLYSADAWRSDDATIATTAALDQRFQDEVNDTLTKAELAALSDVMPDNDDAVPTTGATKDYIDHVIETDILVDATGLNKTGSGGQVTIGISAGSVDLDRIKASDIDTSTDGWSNNDNTIATTAKIDDMIDAAITGDIAVDSTGLSVTDDGDGTITLGIAAGSVDFDRIKASDIITESEQDAGVAAADTNIFTALAAARRFDTFVQTGTPAGSDWEVGKTWLQNDSDLTLSVWNGSAWTAITSGGTFTNQPNVVYVDASSGDDNNDGHRISRPKLSITSAIDQINGEISLSTDAGDGFNGGSSYVDGTYTGVSLTHSSGTGIGTGLTATVGVSGGAVTSVTLSAAQQTVLEEYSIGDVLTASNTELGNSGSGLLIPITGTGDGQIVVVAAGVYREAAPIQIKRRNVSIIGQALRSCIVHPTVATENNTLFELNSGSYIANLTLTGMQAGTGTGNTLDSTLPVTQGWNFAFYNGSYIVKSPYIQNCTNFSDSEIDNNDLLAHRPRGGAAGDTDSAPTGGGMLINGATPANDSPLRSIVADSYTHVGLNGPGILVTNNGYAQITSSYAFFNKYHIKCLNGGQANLAASTTDFGDQALVADGRSTSAIFTADLSTAAGDGDITFTIGAPTAAASWHGTATRPQGNMLVELNSITYPILSATANGAGWDVTISRPNPNNRSENLGLNGAVATPATASFFLRSMVASSGHTMEYVGSGTNYSALPENGGVPDETKQITESNNGKVWTAITDHNGKFKIGGNQTDDPIFEVDQQLGFVTIPEGSIAFNLLSDLTPQLGGNLDVNGQTITSASNGNVVIDPDGTGTISLGADTSVTGDLTVDTDTLYVDATNDRVGIGTASPSRQLVVNGGASSSYIQICNTNSGTESTDGLQLKMDSAGAIADIINRENGDMRFFTNNDQKMVIDSSGNVGIGTASPTAVSGSTVLEVQGTSGAEIVIGTTDTTATAGDLFGGIAFKSADSNGTPPHYSGIQARAEDAFGGATLNFYVGRDNYEDNDPRFVIEGPQSVTGEALRIDSSGRLLVGTPTALATVGGSGASTAVTPTVQFAFSGGNSGLLINRTDAFAANIYLASGSDSNAPAEDGILGILHFQGWSSAATAYRTAAWIRAEVDGEPDTAGDTTDMPGRLVFSTSADGASSPSPRMTIKSDGNVGIGDTEPGELLSLSQAVTTEANLLSLTGTSFADGEKIFTTFKRGSVNLARVGVEAAGSGQAGHLIFETAPSGTPTERARIDSSGRLLIGTPTSTAVGSSASALLQVNFDTASIGQSVIRHSTSASSGAVLAIGRSKGSSVGDVNAVAGGDSIGEVRFAAADGTNLESIAARIVCDVDATVATGSVPGRMEFYTTASGGTTPLERMRLDSDGIFRHLSSSTSLGAAFASTEAAGTTTVLLSGRRGATSVASGTEVFRVYTNGDIETVNGTIGSISDIKLKENIVDANSQWDDFKAVRFRKYNFKEETGHETFTQLGVIAQELETVCPGLVTETIDRDEDGNDLGTTTKSVKYSILTHKALVALQEAMERIETLEAKVAALEAN